MKRNTLLSAVLVLIVFFGLPVKAQNSNLFGDPATNVCAPLKADGVTKGLFSLCVAYCKINNLSSKDTQSNTSNTRQANLSRVSELLLRLYNRRSKQTDPEVPCLEKREGLLDAPDDTPILGATKNVNEFSPITDEQISKDIYDRPFVRTQIYIDFFENVTAGEVNALLNNFNAKIVGSISGGSALVVEIPDPGDPDSLDSVVFEIDSESIVESALKSYLPEFIIYPDNVSLYEEDPVLASQKSIMAPAAWNAKRKIGYLPTVLVVDNFGDGPPNGDLDAIINPTDNYFSILPATDEKCIRPDPSILCPSTHGYPILGVIAGYFGGDPLIERQRVTGIFPGTINLQVIEDGPLSWDETMIEIILRVQQLTTDNNGNYNGDIVILNTSFGYRCINSDTTCKEPKIAKKDGKKWAKWVRQAGIENKFLHLTGAGNKDLNFVIQGEAKFSSPFASAALNELVEKLPNGGTRIIPKLSNIVVVENADRKVSATGQDGLGNEVTNYAPKCIDATSFEGGHLAGIGERVYSFLNSNSNAGFSSGTSISAPQIAGMAAYLLSIDSTLSPQKIKDILISTSDPVLAVESSVLCSKNKRPTNIVNAYHALLALDGPLPNSDIGVVNAPIRLSLLDVADGAGNRGSNGLFDRHDLEIWLQELTKPTWLNFSRFDLNGDGFTGGANTAKFNLDGDRDNGSAQIGNYIPKYERIPFNFRDFSTNIDEYEVTDFKILCYYAYSPLYSRDNGDLVAREMALASYAEQCGASPNKIGFVSSVSNSGGNFEVHTMNEDGGDLTRLTNHGQSNVDDILAVWSPDGSHIAFLRNFDNGISNGLLYVMNSDGTNVRRLSVSSDFDTAPTWSSDGQQIAFTSFSSGDPEFWGLWVVNVDGTGLKRLYNGCGGRRQVSWSPDSTKVAIGCIDPTAITNGITILRADGSGISKTIKVSMPASGVSWSPDGTKLAFKGCDQPDICASNLSLFVMNLDGTDKVDITPVKTVSNACITWSPDGSHLAFVDKEPFEPNFDLFVANVGGSNLVNLGDVDPGRCPMSWSSDSQRLAISAIGSTVGSHIETVNSDGNNRIDLINFGGNGKSPNWVAPN